MISSLISGLFWLYLAWVMSVADYGQLTYQLSIGAIVGAVSIVGMNVVAITSLAKGESKVANQARWLVAIVSVVAGAATAAIFGKWYQLPLVVGNAIFVMVLADYLGTINHRKYFYYSVSQRVLQVGLSLALYTMMGVDGIIIGYSAATLILCTPFFSKLRILDFGFDELRKRKNFVVHGYSVELSQTMIALSDRLLIAPLFGYAILAMYHLGSQFITFFALVPATLYNYLLPRESKGIQTGKVVKLGFGISVIIPVLFLLFSPYVIPTLFPKYADAVPLMQTMMFALIPLTIVYTATSRLLAGPNSRYVLYGVGMFIGIQYSLIYVLGALWNGIGLALALVIALSIQAAMLQIMYFRSKQSTI